MLLKLTGAAGAAGASADVNVPAVVVMVVVCSSSDSGGKQGVRAPSPGWREDVQQHRTDASSASRARVRDCSAPLWWQKKQAGFQGSSSWGSGMGTPVLPPAPPAPPWPPWPPWAPPLLMMGGSVQGTARDAEDGQGKRVW